MLVLTRKTGETIFIGESIKITIVRIEPGRARVAIDAPRDMPIMRGELVGRDDRLGAATCIVEQEND